jgi:Vacuolar protein sorting-associated protein 26
VNTKKTRDVASFCPLYLLSHLLLLRFPSSSIAAGSAAHESETLTRFEIMDGCPVRGERIPIRLYLGGLSDLTPSYPNVANSYSVRYFLNLVLVDEEDRRYFKQAAIDLWRKELKPPAVF